MKKLIPRYQRLNVKFRACVNLLCIALCVFLIYTFLGSPALSVTNAFRRAEKANLVGPAKILARTEPEGTPYSHLIVADDGNGVILFTFDRWDSKATELLYIQKTGCLTIAAAPDSTLFFTQKEAVIPLVLFDEECLAVRAELDITLTGQYKGQTHEKTYNLHAQREFEGCFLFSIHARSAASLGAEGQLLFALQNVTGNSMAATVGTRFPATVRLYDGSGALILEESLFIQSAAARAHAEHSIS